MNEKLPPMLILYTTEDGKNQVQLRAKDQTVWLTQRDMAELFAVSTDNIGLHLKNIFEDAELSREATTEESSVVQIEGAREVQRPVTLYNLDAILAVGYRVKCSSEMGEGAVRSCEAQPSRFHRPHRQSAVSPERRLRRCTRCN
jgi:hypothetical protein